MKSILIILLLVVSCFSEEIEGFRDLKWGDGPDKLGKFEVIEKNVNEKFFLYTKEKESLIIGDVKLSSIEYGFFDNKLFIVLLNFSGEDNLRKIKKAFEAKYQIEWFRENRYIEHYFYSNKKVHISVECGSTYKKCNANISNVELANKYIKYCDSVAKKGAKDL